MNSRVRIGQGAYSVTIVPKRHSKERVANGYGWFESGVVPNAFRLAGPHTHRTVGVDCQK